MIPDQDGATHDHDVIMLAKELTNSNQLSQKPQVILTHSMLKLLSQPIQPAARNKLADRACKEFLFFNLISIRNISCSIESSMYILK